MGTKRQALFWGSFFLAIVGFVLHIHQMFTMAAALACLPLIALLLGRHKLRGLRVVRQAPAAISAGETARVTLDVNNDSRTRRLFFIVADRLPEALQPSEHYEIPVACLGPGEHLRLSYDLQPPRRGAYALGPVELQAPDAIGLRQYRREVGGRAELLVYPRPAALPYLWPAAAGGKQPLRPRRRLRGEGDELYGIRDYVPGDDPRHIDWKTTARRGKLAVVEYERPESLEAMIVLDLARLWHCGEGDRHTLEYGAVLAATLIEQAYERGSTVGLIACGASAFAATASTEEDQRQRLYEALARAQADGSAPLLEVLAAHEHLLPPRCAVAVLSPSPDAGPAGLHLRGLGHSVTWFALHAPSFDRRLRADYDALEGMLAGARCRTHLLRGDVPLAAHWRRGATAGVAHATV